MQLIRNTIYRYHKGTETPLCVYLCGTQAKNKILIVPLSEDESEATYKLSVTRQYAVLDAYQEIYTDALIAPLYLKSRPVQLPSADIKVIQSYIITDIMHRITDDAKNHTTSAQIFEQVYQFLKWKQEKLLMNLLPYRKKTSVYENGIYWISMGVNVGTELNKNRPALIWKKRIGGNNECDFSYIIIPITSKHKNKNYYMNVPVDINGRSCFLRIEDMKRVNIRRISRPITDSDGKILFIDNDKRREIMEAIKRFYIFENIHTDS